MQDITERHGRINAEVRVEPVSADLHCVTVVVKEARNLSTSRANTFLRVSMLPDEKKTTRQVSPKVSGRNPTYNFTFKFYRLEWCRRLFISVTLEDELLSYDYCYYYYDYFISFLSLIL
jgi:hypothetical protein